MYGDLFFRMKRMRKMNPGNQVEEKCLKPLIKCYETELFILQPSLNLFYLYI